MLHIALLDPAVAQEIENTHIKPYFKIDKFEKLDTIDDYKSIGLEFSDCCFERDSRPDTLVVIDGIEFFKFINFKIRLDMGIFISLKPRAGFQQRNVQHVVGRPGLYCETAPMLPERNPTSAARIPPPFDRYRGCAFGPKLEDIFTASQESQTDNFPLRRKPPFLLG